MDPPHHLQRNRLTASFPGRLVIDGLDQGQKRFPENRGLHLIQEALATRPLFGKDLLVVREAQLEGGGHPFQSQSWIRTDFSGFFRCSLVRSNEVIPYLQPIVDLASGKPIGLECLMRWQIDTSEIITPSGFLPISQLAGLSGELDLQVIEKALKACHELEIAAPGQSLRLSVNLSALLLENEALRNRLLNLIRSTPLPPGWQLQVELVEDYLQINDSELGSFLNILRQEGVSFAIDDFGTGYSSLSRLHNYPVQIVKVDYSFVRRIDALQKPSNQLLKTIQTLGRDLSLEVTAEGVETEAQRTWLL